MDQLKNTINNIKKLKIQGANAIAMASLNSFKKYCKSIQHSNKHQLVKNLKRAINELSGARPTEPLNQNLLKFIKLQIEINKPLPATELKKSLNESIIFLQELVEDNIKRIAANGIKLIKNNQNIFTHCHSSTVEKILVGAHKRNKKPHIFNTETRPLFQGRITAKNLLKNNLKVTMVSDSAADFLISEASGKDLMMDAAILGADAILPDGSVINKIGSYGIGLSCFYSKIPLYIAGNLLKFYSGAKLPIETRQASELWPGRPKKLKIINFAFDKIPPEFISGIITEFGIIKPKQAAKIVNKNYPWL